MKKTVLSGLLFLISVACLSAGDVATFVDKGFSEDGKYYVFGQYGRTDKKYQGWAEIYQVEIAKNDFLESGVFKMKPTAVTADKTGIEVYEALEAKSFYHMKTLNCQKAEPDKVLYICDDPNKAGTDKIVFKDFMHSDIEKPNTYNIQLVPTISGYGQNVKSSFYIMVEKKDSDGNLISRTQIGSPDVVRKGVSNYKIERIMCDKSEKNFIFVVEKTMEDDTGVSIRYMVEAGAIR